MIDKDHQNKGYGRAAMKLVLDIIKQDKAYNRIFLSFEPNNDVAKKMYEGFGFVPDGRVIDDEIVYVLNYDTEPQFLAE
jgi:diamine N-acetyltransferase